MDPEPGLLLLTLMSIGSLPIEVWIQLLIFFVLLACSFIISASESAFFSLTQVELSELRDDPSPFSQRIYELMQNDRKLLATILIANNSVNVAAILVASFALKRISTDFNWDPSISVILEVVLITTLILFIGEIVPKVFASNNKLGFSKTFALPMELLIRFFSIPAALLLGINSLLERSMNKSSGRSNGPNSTLEDLKQVIDIIGHEENSTEEKKLLKGIVNFSNTPVRSIMRPRVDVIAVEIDTPFTELVEFINLHGFSRMPVYEDNLDHIAGILHIKDLLPYLESPQIPTSVTLTNLLREVHYVPENKKIDVLLDEFKNRRSHMAIVVDEFGGTAGIVTLEDVIEEIFGELHDEFDSEEWFYSKLSDEAYIFEGRISLTDLKRILNLNEAMFEDARGDSDTLGGLILELHGKIPTQGEIILYRNFELHVEGVSRNRITQVKMLILPVVEEE